VAAVIGRAMVNASGGAANKCSSLVEKHTLAGSALVLRVLCRNESVLVQIVVKSEVEIHGIARRCVGIAQVLLGIRQIKHTIEAQWFGRHGPLPTRDT
jgi:hypothetical protein